MQKIAPTDWITSDTTQPKVKLKGDNFNTYAYTGCLAKLEKDASVNRGVDKVLYSKSFRDLEILMEIIILYDPS